MVCTRRVNRTSDETIADQIHAFGKTIGGKGTILSVNHDIEIGPGAYGRICNRRRNTDRGQRIHRDIDRGSAGTTRACLGDSQYVSTVLGGSDIVDGGIRLGGGEVGTGPRVGDS